MFRNGPRLGLTVLLAGGCGHATETTRAEGELAAAQQSRAARLEGDLQRYEERITELETRMALLEHEARGERVVVRPGQTVRIGAERNQRPQVVDAPSFEDGSGDAVELHAASTVPVLRLHGDSRRAVASEQELGPLPAPPPGVSMQLPVVALPALQARATAQSDDAAREEYRLALEQLRAKRYADAATALERFVARHGAHGLADSAAYWLGEAYYAQRDYGRALEVFEMVVTRHPKAEKLPDALLKLALCHKRLGDTERAQAYLKRVRQEFPNSVAAQAATREGSS